ncbi:MAG: DUF1844 domain-containing protein [Polyangia bacterium]
MSEHDHDAPQADEELDFSAFMLSLASSALVHLGELEHPEHANTSENLALAKQSLDILGLLQEKTRGNLTDDEQKLLEQLLYELRLKYVAARG